MNSAIIEVQLLFWQTKGFVLILNLVLFWSLDICSFVESIPFCFRLHLPLPLLMQGPDLLLLFYLCPSGYFIFAHPLITRTLVDVSCVHPYYLCCTLQLGYRLHYLIFIGIHMTFQGLYRHSHDFRGSLQAFRAACSLARSYILRLSILRHWFVGLIAFSRSLFVSLNLTCSLLVIMPFQLLFTLSMSLSQLGRQAAEPLFNVGNRQSMS